MRDNEIVVPSGLVNQRKIMAGVQKAAKALAPDVVRINYDLGSDWIGNPSVFFRIVLTDQASRPENLREVAQRVTLKITNEAKMDQSGLHTYFNFRSVSEQAKLREPAWT